MSSFVGDILSNPSVRVVLERLPALGLPDAWLVSGALFQTVWNRLEGRPHGYGIRDYDVFYFDPDTSWDAEDAAIRRAREVFSGLGLEIEVRNQARVHLWYAEKFGAQGYPRLRCATEALEYFLMPCCMVAARLTEQGPEVAAPRGLHDLYARIVRPNRIRGLEGRAERYHEKADRWARLWPSLTILPWDAN